ncbi:MAG: chromosomal replication initiator protein DnaA [Chloroflexota bacterium]
MTPQDAWNAAYNQLELQLDRASFDTWLRKTVFLGVEESVFVIGVHNSYAQDMLQYRLYRNIRRVLSDIVGTQTELRFEVNKTEQKKLPFGLGEPDDTPSETAPLFKFMQQQQSMPDLPEASHNPADTNPSNSTYGFADRFTPQMPDSDLNPRYCFERFVVNRSNQVVYEAALAVAEYPATMYNPFFVYGGVGLGKTHLLQSIANICEQRGLRTMYIPSEVFTNDLVSSIRSRQTAMFREKYRSVDVLLVDDIQFIGGKETTQEEFFHTFNALVNFNKQIVLASDRHPNELKTLEDRLRSRFQGGLVADIAPPEFETRVAIMQMWAQERGVKLSSEIIDTVAMRAPNNVRELEGVFNQILAQTRFGNVDVPLPRVEDTLQRFHAPRERASATLERIIEVTAERFSLRASDLEGKKRAARINKARQIAMYLCRDLTEHSLPQIGEAFGGRSHTTVLHGINKIEESLEFDGILEKRIHKIRKDILGITGD